MSEEIINKLRSMAIETSKNTHSPYSKVLVGSALITTNDKYYSGCNVGNSSFGATICAERVEIFKAIADGEKRISKLYVYTEAGWPPCGMCRQVISEFATEDTEIIIGDGAGKETIISFKELLPLAFTPDKLDSK